MPCTTDQLYPLIQTRAGAKNIRPDTDIYREIKLYGDDFEELLADYAKTCNVDMRGYLWYFPTEKKDSAPARCLSPRPIPA